MAIQREFPAIAKGLANYCEKMFFGVLNYCEIPLWVNYSHFGVVETIVLENVVVFCALLISSKTKGPGEEGAPRRNHQKFRLRNWPISSAAFPMTPLERSEHQCCTILALFGRRILGLYPAAPGSPGPFGLLLS